MFSSNLRTALMGAGAAMAFVAGPALAGQADDLKSQIDSLQSRLDQLEKQQATTETKQVAAPADAVVGGDFPGSYKVPGSDTSYAFHGYAKFGAAYDLNQSTSDAFTVDGLNANNTAAGNQGAHFSSFANQSVFRFETRTPTDYGQMITVIEGDMRAKVGSSGAASDPTTGGIYRLRLAYGVLGPVEAGKDFELMGNDFASAPEKVNYWGPQGPGYGARLPVLRYTYNTGKWMLAGELAAPSAGGSSSNQANNEGVTFQNAVLAGSGGTAAVAADQYTTAPTFNGALNYTDSWGHVAVRGKLRQISLTNGGGSTIAASGVNAADHTLSAWSYAGYLGGNLNVGQFLGALGKDSLGGAMIWGTGDIQDLSGANDAESATVYNYGGTSQKIALTPMHGFQMNYRHWWTDTIRSNIMWGLSQASPSHDLTVDATGAAVSNAGSNMMQQTNTVWGNVIWSPVKSVNFGIEYMWGEVHRQTNVAGYGNTATGGYSGYGSDSRIELGMQYLF